MRLGGDKTTPSRFKYLDVPQKLSRKQRKTQLAHEVEPYWTKELIRSSFDLATKLDEVVAFIRKHNDID